MVVDQLRRLCVHTSLGMLHRVPVVIVHIQVLPVQVVGIGYQSELSLIRMLYLEHAAQITFVRAHACLVVEQIHRGIFPLQPDIHHGGLVAHVLVHQS